jgi:hypothetical protein
MKPRSTLKIILAAALGALAIFVLPAAASAKDRNHDRIPDRWEQRHDLSLNVNQARHDQDHDGLRNRGEFEAGDNPRDGDSDGDGVMDGEENAGTITAFDATSGKLTISVFNGDTISGLVNAGTEIKCEGPEHASTSVLARDGGPGPSGSDDNGGHGTEPGDDNGGHGEEAGDDNGGHGQEPGDDNGGQGEEPGDDNGGHGEEPGDDNGGGNGDVDNSGPGSANSGPGGEDNGNGGEHGVVCTTADLQVGAVVQEADLEIEHGNAFFDEVELAHTP